MKWSKEELQKIAEADDLHISPLREDGSTYGTPTWIWSVAVDDALYVRGYNGQKSRWYNPPGLLPDGRLIPARLLPVVAPHVKSVVDCHGPNPRRRAVGHAIVPGRYVQVISLGDFAQFVL